MSKKDAYMLLLSGTIFEGNIISEKERKKLLRTLNVISF